MVVGCCTAEVLHKRDDQVKPELNTWYLRELLRVKQQELVAERRRQIEAAWAKEEAAANGGGGGGGAAPTFASSGSGDDGGGGGWGAQRGGSDGGGGDEQLEFVQSSPTPAPASRARPARPVARSSGLGGGSPGGQSQDGVLVIEEDKDS